MEQVRALTDRIRLLKTVAASMREGAIHTRSIPEVDKILALPDELGHASVGAREAVGRQVREYEQAFDRLGYALLKQIMPATSVSPIFRIARAAQEFKAKFQARLTPHQLQILTRYSLSIGTPPVTAGVEELVARTLFGAPLDALQGHAELLACERRSFEALLDQLRALVTGGLHYSTAEEEKQFLGDAARFINFEGAGLLNRVVITESPERVLDLIRNHVFDKFGPAGQAPVEVIEEGAGLGRALVEQMKQRPDVVFAVKVSRIPHALFADEDFRGVLGRLLLVDVSPRARRSNTTIVYTLFPHVARTLGNIQTSLSGRPANTQLTLRRILESFSPAALAEVDAALARRVGELEAGFADGLDVESLRARESTRDAFFAALSLRKLGRMTGFLHAVAGGTDETLELLAGGLREAVAGQWMRYFYGGLDRETYRAAVLPGGGRGALRLVAEHHRDEVQEHVARFVREQLPACRARLLELKSKLAIPATTSEEIEAAQRQSQLRDLSPSQWKVRAEVPTRGEHFANALSYRMADLASRAAKSGAAELDRAAFANLTGPLAALLKKSMSRAGLSALHGHLESGVVEKVQEFDRMMRLSLVPMQEALHEARRAAEELKGETDPSAVGEIERALDALERGTFSPALVLPEMAWSYQDVFPEKDYPRASMLRIPLNARHEMDPDALLEWLEQQRHLYLRFPEIFALVCRTLLVVVNSPHNPTGVVWRRETILKLLKIAADFGLTLCDDDSYHRILRSDVKAREGDASVAQLYEENRALFARPVRIHTVGATTKGLQGSGDRTGLLHSNDPACVAFAERAASRPNLMSLYLTQLKLESGLACKRYTSAIEALAAELVNPASPRAPWDGMKALLERELATMREPGAPVAAFEVLLDGYQELLRLRQRDARIGDLSTALSGLVKRLKGLRLERRLRDDVEKRFAAMERARLAALPEREAIAPEGAFYACVRLCAAGDDRGVNEFLQAMARNRKVDATYAGSGFIRISLGGRLRGDEPSYERFGKALEVYLGLLASSWARFEAAGRSLSALEGLFTPPGGDPLEAMLADLKGLLDAHPPEKPRLAARVEPSERGFVYCIEEGRSVADKIFVEWRGCESVEELLASRPFRVIYRRLLKKVYRTLPALADVGYEGVENQYGPLACLEAYRDRQQIDDVFREVLRALHRAWQGAGTFKVLLARLDASNHGEKVAALRGVDRELGDLLRDLLHAFDGRGPEVEQPVSFAVGCELLTGLAAHPTLPRWLQRLVAGCEMAGATAALDPKPVYVTGAAKRVSDFRYGFARRDGTPADGKPPLELFERRLDAFAAHADCSDYLCKAAQVGPYKMLVVMHKSCFHLVADELRLYPQIEEVQSRAHLDGAAWDGVMLFGIPAAAMGESYRTGYVLARRSDAALLPVSWVAREDATDYVGFFKKTLLTMHNERVKQAGGLPIHGSMVTLTFKNGLRKTLVFTADSGTGKSETITAMMEQGINAEGPAAELSRVDILSGDMLSLWRGEDAQLYAFGTESGDFLRLPDITESWKAHFGDLLERGSYSNLDHPKNPRVTIPGICDVKKLLSPTRVNCFFYIDNYSAPAGSAVELADDPDPLLRTVVVRGLRKNKGTSGDQPSLRAGLELAGNHALLTRFGLRIDELLDWQELVVAGKKRTCLSFRDGQDDVFAAAELVSAAFVGQSVQRGERRVRIAASEYDVLQNLYWLRLPGEGRVPLDRELYDTLYEPVVSTFCGDPFVDPLGMERVLEAFAATMRAAKVQTGVLKTQLAREGSEFSGPAKAARDVVTFLLEDEEVNARFQRNKGKVGQALRQTFGAVLEPGSNLPVELEGYNLLLLELHESRHVAFCDLDGRHFTLSTPFYRFEEGGGAQGSFAPALLLPRSALAIRDICTNPDHDQDLSQLEIDLRRFEQIRSWGSREELIYQVLLAEGVVTLATSDRELSHLPDQVRKAAVVADGIAQARAPRPRRPLQLQAAPAHPA